jgi:hypothetical protein
LIACGAYLFEGKMTSATDSGSPQASAPRDPVINPASNKTINFMGICYLILAVLFFYLLITTWPVLESGGKSFKIFNIFGLSCSWAPDRHMMFTVMMAGALGSLTHTWTSFGDYVGNSELSTNWIWFFILRIPVGVALAILFYFIIRGGLLLPTVPVQHADDITDATVKLNAYSIAAFSALAGMFSKQATDKLAAVFDVVFTKNSEREGALGSSQPLKVVPPALTKGKREDLTVTGTGFQKGGTNATINGKKRDFVPSSETEGKVATRDEDVTAVTTLKLVITNPNKDSFAADVPVVDPRTVAKPVISSTNPTILTAASPKSLIVIGQGFQTGCTATIDGEDRAVTPGDGTRVTVALEGKDIATPRTIKLVIKNTGADGQASEPHDIAVT